MTDRPLQNDRPKAAVRLACQHVWKIYGPDPSRFRAGIGAGDRSVEALADAARSAGHIVAACDVTFDVREGEIFVIMGLSGSGKSTIVRCLSRIVEPTAGEVILDGEDLLRKSRNALIEIRRHKMGMVFQNFGLLPHLNVIDNVAFPLKLQGMPPAERRKRAERVIALVGLQGREDSFPRQLSGGQQQRVGIARSLAVEPELWLLDEPFSALDPLIRRQMQDEFLRIQQLLRKSIVFITHDFLEALRIADRMAIMREGRIVQIGTPFEMVTNPVDSYVAEFTGDVPWIRVLQAADVAEPRAGHVDGLPQVPATLPLEALLPRLADSFEGLVVTDGAGSPIGVATPRSVIATLARGAGDGTAPAAGGRGGSRPA
jgi:glycine betaine/proline transport system ATP-binding protein